MINYQSQQTQSQHLLLSCIGCETVNTTTAAGGITTNSNIVLQHTSCCGQIICENCRILLCQSNGSIIPSSNMHSLVDDDKKIQKSQQTQTILENLRNHLKSCNSCSLAHYRKKTIPLIEAPYLGILLDVITKQNQQGCGSDISSNSSRNHNDNASILCCARCSKSQLQSLFHCNTCNAVSREQKQIQKQQQQRQSSQQSQHARRLLFKQSDEGQQQEQLDPSSLQNRSDEYDDTSKRPSNKLLLCSECSESIHSIGSFITHDIEKCSVEYLQSIASQQYLTLQEQIKSAVDSLALAQQQQHLHSSSSSSLASPPSVHPLPSNFSSSCNLHFGRPIKKICTFDYALLCDSCIDSHRSNCIGNIASIEMAQRGMRESLLLGLQDIENIAANMHAISEGIAERITEIDIKLHSALTLKENQLISELRMQCLQVKEQYLQGKSDDKVGQQTEMLSVLKQLVLTTLQASPPLSIHLLQSQKYFSRSIAEMKLQAQDILAKEQGKGEESNVQEILSFEKQLEELTKSAFQEQAIKQMQEIIKGVTLNSNNRNDSVPQKDEQVVPRETQFFMSKLTNIGQQQQQLYGNSKGSALLGYDDISRCTNITMNNSKAENNQEFFSGILQPIGVKNLSGSGNEEEVEDSYEEASVAGSKYQQQQQQAYTSTQSNNMNNNNNSSFRSISSNYMSEVSISSSVVSQQNINTNNNTEIHKNSIIQGKDRQNNSSTHDDRENEITGRNKMERQQLLLQQPTNGNKIINTTATVNQLAVQEAAQVQTVMTKNGSGTQQPGVFSQNGVMSSNNTTKSATPFQNANSSSKSIGVNHNNTNTNSNTVTSYLLQNTRIASFCENSDIEVRQAYKGKMNTSNNNKSQINQESTNTNNGSTTNIISNNKTTTTTSLHINSNQDRQARDKTVSKNLSSVQSPTPPVRENSRTARAAKSQQQQLTPVKRSPSVAASKQHSETSGKYSQSKHNMNAALTGLSAGKSIPKSLHDITDLLVNRDLLLFNTEIAKNPLAQRIIAKTYSTCTSIMLQWSHMSNLPADVKYIVEYGIGLKISGQEKFTRIYTGQEPSHVINKLQPKTTYRVRVCAAQIRRKHVKSQQDQQSSELPSSVVVPAQLSQEQSSQQQSLCDDKGSNQSSNFDSMTSSDYEFGDWSEIHSISTQDIQTFEGYECCSVSRKDKDITVQYDKPGLVISAYPYSYGRITWTITAIIDSHDCGEDINACLIVGVSSKGSRKQQAVIGSTVNYGLHREKFKVKVCLDMQRLVMVIVTPQQPNGETFNSLPNTPLFPAFHNKTNNRTSSLKLLVSFE